MVCIRNLDSGFLDDVFIIVESHAGLHDTEGIKIVVNRSLLDDRGKIFAFFFLCQVSQRLDDTVGCVCGYVRSVYCKHVRQSACHDGSIYFIRVTAAAVISRHELNVCKILSVISLIKSFYRFFVSLTLLSVLD